MTNDALHNLLQFLGTLRQHRLFFTLNAAREDAVMVSVTVPGERWEVEFFVDGEVQVEQFVSDGHIADELSLRDLIQRFGETG